MKLAHYDRAWIYRGGKSFHKLYDWEDNKLEMFEGREIFGQGVDAPQAKEVKFE